MARHRPPAVGIDFGTSTSLIARRQAAEPAEIFSFGSRRWLPSLVGRQDGRFIAGDDAESLAPDQIIRSVKRAITFDQPTVTLGGREGGAKVSRDDAITEILRELARRAKEGGLPLGRQRDIRLGCPAMWRRDQRQLILDLAAGAGLPAKAAILVEEPVAAGLAWLSSGYVDPRTIEGRLLVFDMGGGTLDIAVLDVEGGDPPGVRVLTSVGLREAGDALDEAIAKDLTTELVERGIEIGRLRKPEKAEIEILRQARAVKVRLSTRESQSLAFIPAAFGGNKVPAVRYTRDRLEEVFCPQMAAAEEKVWDALRLARLTHYRGSSTSKIFRTSIDELARDVHYLLLAGGMSRIPYVKRRLTELLPKAKLFDSIGVAADETVVAGLTDNSGADLINLYRPGFDFTLTWDGGQSLRLYEAYTPLYEMYQLYTMYEPSYTYRAGRRQGIPQQRQGDLHVSTPSGDRVNLVHVDKYGQEHVIERLPIRFGFHDLLFRLRCDGRVYISDGTNEGHQLRVEPWPVIHGPDSRQEPEEPPDPPVYYPFNKP
jgi:molecular chaperone DnaK